MKDGLWEMGCDIRNDMVSGEMIYVDFIRDLATVKAGEPFARLLTSSGSIRELNAPMTAEIRELNNNANDVISSLQSEHASEGWLVWLARVFPLEL
jgi:glycine cleavage system H lipoate-binding protein